MRETDFTPASIILHRMQAERAFKELEVKRLRFRLAGIVRTVWTGRTFLVRLTFLGFALGVLISSLIPPLYTSTTRLMPPDNQSGSALGAIAASMATSRGVSGFGDLLGNKMGLKNSSDIFVGILKSRTVQNEIIQHFDLKRVYGTGSLQDARGKLTSRVDFSVDRMDHTISISVADRSAQLAADMAKAYVDQLNRLVSELSTSSARRERIFLENRLLQVNLDLQAAEREFSQFAGKHSSIDIQEQGRAILGTTATLQAQLMLAESELQGLRKIYTDSNVRVRALEARIAGLQSQLQKFGLKDQSTVDAAANLQALPPAVGKLPKLGATYADLYRRAKVQEALSDLLTQECELAKVQEAKEIPTISVLDVADVPERRSSPPRLAFVGMASMLLACTVGMSLLITSKIWNEADPHDPGRAVFTEIWFDLKQKRFLTSVNGSQGPNSHPGQPLQRSHSFLSILGWKNATSNGRVFHASTEEVSEGECESNLPGSSGNGLRH